eukprot:GFYU01003499.1.p1 GENE.GFYU01003499.1~~GFYU01003499.1.p1  ORF type:complete len:516 (-),score=162.86 GFYU01003499.1:192-1739(-)
MGQDVWHRIIQIITNNEEVQTYATKTVFDYLGPPHPNEVLVIVGSYLLGEFGHKIAGNQHSPPQAQLERLHRNYNTVSAGSKALMLSAYVKLGNAHASLKPTILNILKAQSNVMDPEIQQRANEYAQMLENPSVAPVLGEVLEMMPNFTERESLLERRLQAHWQASGEQRASLAQPGSTGGKIDASADEEVIRAESESQQAAPPPNASADLLGLDDIGSAPPPVHDVTGAPAPSLTSVQNPLDMDVPPADSLASLNLGGASVLNPQGASGGDVVDTAYWTLCGAADGVLFEDANLQIGFKSEYSGANGRLGLYYGNKSTSPLTGVHVTAASFPQARIDVGQLAPMIAPQDQVFQPITVEALQAFATSPVLSVSFAALSGPVNLSLKLPVVVTKFTVPVGGISGEEFFARWNGIPSAAPQEQKLIFKRSQPYDMSVTEQLLTASLNVGSLKGVDPNPNNLVGAGSFRTATAETPILLRLETIPDQNLFRLTVRTSNGALSEGVKNTILGVYNGIPQ